MPILNPPEADHLIQKAEPMTAVRLAEPVSVYLRIKGSPDRGSSLDVAVRKVHVDGAPFWVVLSRATNGDETVASATLCGVERRASVINRDILNLLECGLLEKIPTRSVGLSSGGRVRPTILSEMTGYLGVNAEVLTGKKRPLTRRNYTIGAGAASWDVHKHPAGLAMMNKGYRTGESDLADLLRADLGRIMTDAEFTPGTYVSPIWKLSLTEVRGAYAPDAEAPQSTPRSLEPAPSAVNDRVDEPEDRVVLAAPVPGAGSRRFKSAGFLLGVAIFVTGFVFINL